jgi:hypothetical protein
MLLLNMDEYTAFVCLANMIHSYHFLKFFRMEVKQVKSKKKLKKTIKICIICETIKLLMSEFSPQIFTNFEKQGVRLQSFVMDWYITLFSKSFEMESAARLWDRYFLEGEIFLYRATLGIFDYFKDKIEHGSFEEIMKTLTKATKNVDVEEMFKNIDSFKVITKKTLEKARKEAEIHVSNKKDVYY